MRPEKDEICSAVSRRASLAVDVMRRGGVILYPTDTVWGIGCDASCVSAVERVFEIKRRADSKALICLVGSLAQLERWVTGIPPVAYELIEAAVRPLTIVYDGALGLAPALTAPDGSIGVRLTRDPFCREMCRQLGRPVVSTSANISGFPTPRSFAEISGEIVSAVDHVVDPAGEADDSPCAVPSTVIKLGADSTIKILRP